MPFLLIRYRVAQKARCEMQSRMLYEEPHGKRLIILLLQIGNSSQDLFDKLIKAIAFSQKYIDMAPSVLHGPDTKFYKILKLANKLFKMVKKYPSISTRPFFSV